MKILDRYIARSVLFSIFITLVILLTLVAFGSLIEELGDVGKGNYSTSDAFFYVLLVLPRRTYEIFPAAALLGSLVGLGAMATHSELTAIRSAGVSLARIIFSVLKASLAAMLLILLVGEVVAPHTEQLAERLKAERVSKQISLKSKYGFWARNGNTFVNIRKILPGSQLRDIYIYELSPELRMQVVTHAAFARYEQDHWLLMGIKQSRFTGNGVVSKSIEQTTWDSMLSPSVLDVVVVRPTMLTIQGLYRYIHFLHENGQEAVRYQVAFWSKIFNPLFTMVMVFFAVPFVFGVLRSVTIGQRIFAGTILGFIFFLINRMFGHLAVVYDMNPLFAAAFPGLLFLMLGLWLAKRVH